MLRQKERFIADIARSIAFVDDYLWMNRTIFGWTEFGLNFKLLSGRSRIRLWLSLSRLFIYTYLFILNFFDYYYHYKRSVYFFAFFPFRTQIRLVFCSLLCDEIRSTKRNRLVYAVCQLTWSHYFAFHSWFFGDDACVCAMPSLWMKQQRNVEIYIDKLNTW